jgi:DNA mismatch endonuclease (patch repair protein)
VHGCFWHRHHCGLAYEPKTRPVASRGAAGGGERLSRLEGESWPARFPRPADPRSRRISAWKRREFWQRKFDRNVRRDSVVRKQLQALGWRVIVVWECQLNRPSRRVASRLVRLLGPPHADRI